MRHTDVNDDYADVRGFAIRVEHAQSEITQDERAHRASRGYLALGDRPWARSCTHD